MTSPITPGLHPVPLYAAPVVADIYGITEYAYGDIIYYEVNNDIYKAQVETPVDVIIQDITRSGLGFSNVKSNLIPMALIAAVSTGVAYHINKDVWEYTALATVAVLTSILFMIGYSRNPQEVAESKRTVNLLETGKIPLEFRGKYGLLDSIHNHDPLQVRAACEAILECGNITGGQNLSNMVNRDAYLYLRSLKRAMDAAKGDSDHNNQEWRELARINNGSPEVPREDKDIDWNLVGLGVVGKTKYSNTGSIAEIRRRILSNSHPKEVVSALRDTRTADQIYVALAEILDGEKANAHPKLREEALNDLNEIAIHGAETFDGSSLKPGYMFRQKNLVQRVINSINLIYNDRDPRMGADSGL